MRSIVAGMVALLSGCVSYGSIQGGEPRMVYTTAKSQDAYLGCVAPRFMDIHGASSTVRDGDSWVVTLPGPTASVSIHASETGSRIEYRQMHDLEWGSFGRARQAVLDCL